MESTEQYGPSLYENTLKVKRAEVAFALEKKPCIGGTQNQIIRL